MAGSRVSGHRQRVISALEQCEESLMRYAVRMVGDQEVARDVVQHAFLQLCSQLGADFPREPKPWLFKVCRNRILDLLRRAGRNEETLELRQEFVSSSAPDPAALAERKDLGDWLQSLVDQLPSSQREVILLWSQGLRYGEIAEITNQTEGGVRVKVHRGFVRLRQHRAVQALLALESADRGGHEPAATRKQGVTAGQSLPQGDRIR